MHRLCLGAVLFLATSPVSTFAQSNLPFEYQAAHAPIPDPGLQAPSAYPRTLRYGDSASQTIALYPAKGAAPAPLVIAFSGSAEGWPRYRFNRAEIALAIVRERETVPTAQKTLGNYLAAITYLNNNTAKLGIDPTRIVLYGDSMAALLGTDPALFERAGVPFASVCGVIVIGGDDFDVVRRMHQAPTSARPISAITARTRPKLPRFRRSTTSKRPTLPPSSCSRRRVTATRSLRAERSPKR